jgi:SAM-dependent methyltransferase
MKNRIINIFSKSIRLKEILKSLNNQFERDDFVISELKKINNGYKILDAGCGSQRYKRHCKHLDYKSQDFGKYKQDHKITILSKNHDATYKYGELDYVGNIWEIDEEDETFDAILCTEVLEHIPYPNETIKELSRLLKPNGKLILTAPSNCLRHFDPYFFYTGFSDRWYEKLLTQNQFEIEKLLPVGDYYSWISVELAREASANGFLTKLILAPAFFYFYNKKSTSESINTLCMGYHLTAIKK